MSTTVRQLPRDRLERTGARARLDWTLIVSPVVTLAVTTWGITASAYWGDEADTVSAVRRSAPQLFAMLGHIDAVHGLYYLLLWPVAEAAGTGEFATRFPSALAMAAAALGITALGRRLVNRWVGLCAGLIFAILPAISEQGQNARPYAVVTAAAVLASYLFVRAVQDPRSRWLRMYGVSLVLVGYLQMFALLLVAAHVVTLIGLGWRQRTTAAGALRSARRWLVTFAGVGVAMAPLIAIGWAQRAAIAWIPRPGWQAMAGAFTWLATGSPVSVVVLTGLGVLGVVRSGRLSPAWPLARGKTAADAGRMIGWLAVPWLAVPIVVLLAVSEIKPVYNTRYITFCLPAVALLAGSGLAALRLPVRAAAFILVLALAIPMQLDVRVPVARLLAASRFLKAHEKPGDAIVYPRNLVPPWNLAYPEGFAPLRDLSLRQPPSAAERLFGTVVPRSVLMRREAGARRIWIVQTNPVTNPGPYIAPGFHRAGVWKLKGGIEVWLYTRPSESARSP
jgi:mannosyltransferase